MAKARKLKAPPARRPRRVVSAKVANFVAQSLGPIDWQQWWAWDDYRMLVNLQVFGQGLASYAGMPPTILALSAGMDAVYQFVVASAPSPGATASPIGSASDSKQEWASAAATEVAGLMYEPYAIAAALGGLLPKWTRKGGLALKVGG